MNRDQFERRHRGSGLESHQLEIKWRMHLREQMEYEELMRRIQLAGGPTEEGGGGGGEVTTDVDIDYVDNDYVE
jgi:hypothetical protein